MTVSEAIAEIKKIDDQIEYLKNEIDVSNDSLTVERCRETWGILNRYKQLILNAATSL